MRKSIVVLAAAALAATGCKALGLHDAVEKDWSQEQMKGGVMLDLDEPNKVRVVKFEPDLKSNPPKVKVALKNEGPPIPLLPLDMEFAFPAPSGSFAPYTPDFVGFDVDEFKAGETKEITVEATRGMTGTPYFSRIVVTKGADVRMTTGREVSRQATRPGSRYLGGKVEVTEVKHDLVGEKPSLAFTLENLSDEEIGNLRYMVQFYKNGELVDLGRRFSSFRPIGKPLGKRGDRLTFEVANLEDQGGLGGAKFVLRLK